MVHGRSRLYRIRKPRSDDADRHADWLATFPLEPAHGVSWGGWHRLIGEAAFTHPSAGVGVEMPALPV